MGAPRLAGVLLLALGACVFTRFSPAVARGEVLRARVLAAPSSDELTREALARAEGELTAAGFHVTVQQTPAQVRPEAAIAAAVADDPTTAVVLLQRTPRSEGDETGEETGLVFWVYEPWGEQTVVVHPPVVAGDPTLSARRGAVQAVEVLRAVVDQRGLAAPAAVRRVAPPAREERAQAPRTPAAPAASVHAGAGIALWRGFEGLGSVLSPVARVVAGLPQALAAPELALDLRASAAGLGPAIELSLVEGRVEVRQALLLGELLLRLWPQAFAQPMLSAGGGAYAVTVDGEANPPFVARGAHTWSALGGAGAGVWFAPLPHLAASLEVQLLWATAPSDVRVAGRVVAEAGAPMLLMGAHLMGGF